MQHQSQRLGAASEWNWARQLSQQEAEALGKREGLPGVTFGQWTLALYLGGSSKVSGQDFCALMDLRQFAVTQSSSKTHPRRPCSLAKGIAVG